ncbi:hypothetical protein V8E36_005745 [Tilletia maclaganii]
MSLPADVAGAPIPRDARIIALIMYSMGITDADPAVLLQLLEFANRYTHDVLQDALVYSDHAASRSGPSSSSTAAAAGQLSLEDIQLAIQSRVNYSFTHPPPKDILVSLASSINSIPLPPISDRIGVRLPPLEHCLTNVNFSIVPNSPPRSPSPEVKLEPPSQQRRTTAAINGHGGIDDDVVEDEGMQDAPGASGTGSSRARWQQDDDYDDPGPPGGHGLSTSGSLAAPPPAPPAASRGTKRALEEDEDYD